MGNDRASEPEKCGRFGRRTEYTGKQVEALI
jgi:hypothetical protein